MSQISLFVRAMQEINLKASNQERIPNPMKVSFAERMKRKGVKQGTMYCLVCKKMDMTNRWGKSKARSYDGGHDDQGDINRNSITEDTPI